MTRSQVCQQFSIYLKKIMLTPSFLLAEALLLASDKPLKVIEPNANCIYDQDCAEIHRSILLLTKKKRGGQNRTAQWSRKGKSKNLGSKRFCFVTQLYLYLKVQKRCQKFPNIIEIQAFETYLHQKSSLITTKSYIIDWLIIQRKCFQF